MNRLLIAASLCAWATLAVAEEPSEAKVVVHEVRDLTRRLSGFGWG